MKQNKTDVACGHMRRESEELHGIVALFLSLSWNNNNQS